MVFVLGVCLGPALAKSCMGEVPSPGWRDVLLTGGGHHSAVRPLPALAPPQWTIKKHTAWLQNIQYTLLPAR